jgi:hypothetical protein
MKFGGSSSTMNTVVSFSFFVIKHSIQRPKPSMSEKRKHLSLPERNSIVGFLLVNSTNSKLRLGSVASAAAKYDVMAAGTCDGWTIRLMCQTPKSPDFNVLDLGYFASIDCLLATLLEVVRAVNNSYAQLPMESLEDNFLNLQKVLECAIEHNGGNQYKLPHMKKKKLRKANKLPITFRWDAAIMKKENAAMKMEVKYFKKPKKRGKSQNAASNKKKKT